jgi:AraC-like DNA-binding protein
VGISGQQSFRFATDLPPARGRVPVQDMLENGIWRFDFAPSPDTPFFVNGRMHLLPGLVLADVATSAGRTRRTSEHLVDDQFLFNICLDGTSAVSQCGRTTTISAGDAVLSMGAEKAAMSYSASRFLSFRLPAKAVTTLVPDAEDRVARPIRRGAGALKLLTGYAATLQDLQAEDTLQRLAVTHVYDLVALALGAVGDPEASQARGVRAARLREIKADIAASLHLEDLSLATFAARHRLPLRYARRLFEEDGTTFTEFVLELRLTRARRLLTSPCRVNQQISAIAAEAGFNNLSYFNESFRRRFGDTPSGVRAQARCDR